MFASVLTPTLGQYENLTASKPLATKFVTYDIEYSLQKLYNFYNLRQEVLWSGVFVHWFVVISLCSAYVPNSVLELPGGWGGWTPLAHWSEPLVLLNFNPLGGGGLPNP